MRPSLFNRHNELSDWSADTLLSVQTSTQLPNCSAIGNSSHDAQDAAR
ncbi:hypothetical protein [Peterkaempfera sp. SMS 1(5)a]